MWFFVNFNSRKKTIQNYSANEKKWVHKPTDSMAFLI